MEDIREYFLFVFVFVKVFLFLGNLGIFYYFTLFVEFGWLKTSVQYSLTLSLFFLFLDFL